VSVPLGLTALSGRVVDIERREGALAPTVFLVTSCVALVATGFGIVLPVFARRLAEMGHGVSDLALVTAVFAIAQFVAAPPLGTLADRIGRKPLIVMALAGYVIGNTGYVLASNLETLVLFRFLQGAMTAGMFPAAMGLDLSRINVRHRISRCADDSRAGRFRRRTGDAGRECVLSGHHGAYASCAYNGYTQFRAIAGGSARSNPGDGGRRIDIADDAVCGSCSVRCAGSTDHDGGISAARVE